MSIWPCLVHSHDQQQQLWAATSYTRPLKTETFVSLVITDRSALLVGYRSHAQAAVVPAEPEAAKQRVVGEATPASRRATVSPGNLDCMFTFLTTFLRFPRPPPPPSPVTGLFVVRFDSWFPAADSSSRSTTTTTSSTRTSVRSHWKGPCLLLARVARQRATQGFQRGGDEKRNAEEVGEQTERCGMDRE